MNEDEKKSLKDIDSLRLMLLQEPSGQWNGVYTMKPNGYRYSMNAKQMLKKILLLKSNFNPDYLTEECISSYEHTCHKEVSYVEYHYEKASKKNAAKIRYKEFLNSIDDANQQISRDLFLLFQKISNVNDDYHEKPHAPNTV